VHQVLCIINFRQIPPYGLLGACGVLAGILYLYCICKVKKERFDDVIYVYVWAAIGAMVGAKILYLLVSIPDIIATVKQAEVDFLQYMLGMISGGFVFYGGLIGGVGAVFLACRYFALDTKRMVSLMIPSLPLAHAFGRIGCTVVGCCYGIETDVVPGITYAHSHFAPHGVNLFPVQPIEAVCDIVIFVWLVWRLCRMDSLENYDLLKRYLLAYAMVRFILEFFRGDQIRGGLWIFSTSQWISIAIVLLLVVLHWKNTKKYSK